VQIRIAPDSTTPVFEQIVAAVVDAVRSGALVPGHRLPPVRALAAELGVATNTVAKAYRRLEEEGHVETHGRGGTLVRAGGPGSAASAVAARAFVEAARADGLDLGEATGLLRRTW
jgi:GntR family transcriptional regulator